MPSEQLGTLVNQLNLYVDTSRDLGTGDDVSINLQHNSVAAGDGEMLRLSLAEFNMYRNWYGVNENNSKFRLTIDAAVPVGLQLTKQNYQTVGEIAEEMGTRIAASLSTAGNTVILDPTTVSPPIDKRINSNTDNIISFNIVFNTAHNITQWRVQTFTSVGDSFALLGGNRIDDAASTESSFTCTVLNATTLRLVALYPAQRSTETHLYVRTDVNNNNIETASLSAATGPYDTHTLTSNILAKIPLDVEFCAFSSSGAVDEFYVNLRQKELSTLRLFLTDSKGRKLGRISGSASQTAAGTGTAQSTRGNLFFSATLRIDVIRRMQVNELQSAPIPRPIPARRIGPLEFMDFGATKR